ncbi:tail assembly protein [Synergistales bacterium]|nr:tail assembly protein [Synergistales bacterium]
MKTVYSYHPVTGEYMGDVIADVNPKEPGKYLNPAHSTETAPPVVNAQNKPVWDGSAWYAVEDHRGEKGYVNGEETEIKDLGPLPEGWSETLPEPEKTLNQLKAEKIAQITSELDVLDRKAERPAQAIIEAMATGAEPDTEDVERLKEYASEKTVWRELIAQVNVAATVEEVEAVTWAES